MIIYSIGSNSDLEAMPTYIYGTAGMRLISEEEQFQRYEAVKNGFLKTLHGI